MSENDTDNTYHAPEETRPDDAEPGTQPAPPPADGTETPPAEAPEPAEPKQTFVTTEALRHDGEDYPPGSSVDLDEERAEALLKAGTVKKPD